MNGGCKVRFRNSEAGRSNGCVVRRNRKNRVRKNVEKSVDKESKRGYTNQADFGKSMAGNLFMKVLLRNLKINEKSA